MTTTYDDTTYNTLNERYNITPEQFKRVISKNLYGFYTYFVASQYQDQVKAPHIEYLSEVIQEVITNPTAKNRVSIAMPPQHSKSSFVTLATSVWAICNNPNLRVMVVNAEKDLSTSFGISIRNLLYNAGPYFGLNVSRVKSSNTHLMFEKNGKLCKGEIRLTGAHGSVTGHAVDILIIDDPYKGLVDEFTPTQINKKWDWYTSFMEQRVREGTIVILLHTRWNSEDIQGRIKMDEYQRSKYHFIELPAIDEHGKTLWPEAYSRQFYEDKRKTMGERRFQSIYQQKPLDLTSDFFYLDKLIWDERGIGGNYYIADCRSWDMAYTEKKKEFDDSHDFTDGVDAYKISPTYYLFTDFIHGQFGQENIHKVQATARIDGLTKPILIETGTVGGAAKELYNLWRDDYLDEYNTKQSEAIGTKMDRATPLRYAMYDGHIHFHIMNKELRKTIIEQFRAFPNGKHDDMVDACAYAYNYLKDKGDITGIYGTGDTNY